MFLPTTKSTIQDVYEVFVFFTKLGIFNAILLIHHV